VSELRWKFQRDAAKRGGVPALARVPKCGACGRAGHNRKTCRFKHPVPTRGTRIKPNQPLAPDDDGTRYLVEHAGEPYPWVKRTEAEARAKMCPQCVLVRVRIDRYGHVLEREVLE
jgi:hypothetical protein